VNGTVVQVSVSRGGVPKLAVPSAELTNSGLAGDAWRFPFHGGGRKAILLITMEGIDELVSRRFPVFPGALGENLTTSGLDRRALRIGQRFRVGSAEIELTQVRTPCTTLDVYGTSIQAAIFDAQTQAGDPASPRWGLSGFYASVARAGSVRAGDSVALLV
jgi:MOSC domain-containing protein YiiM